jgi:predicted nuclease with TOPRIM domain
MENKELIEAIKDLKSSIDSLTAIQRDIFNTDTTHDDQAETRGKIHELLKSNEELTKSVGFLNAAINDLRNDLKK